ncbi:MAG TPA: GAF domain-containing protein [Anaerolineales bacterium]|nr:GAF domain-containing protein [Anaerolineales bacterium]
MPISASLTVGLGLLIAGILLLALVVGLIDLARHKSQTAPRQAAHKVEEAENEARITSDPPRPTEAVLIVKPGGSFGQINETARQWFQAEEAHPNLERLAQRAYPAEAFLGLCAAPGEVQFTLDGRLVLGRSYEITQAGQRAVLVSLRQARNLLLGTEPSGDPVLLMGGLTRKINANLELEPTLAAILECVEQIIPADLAQIGLWETGTQQLMTYRFFGLPGTDRHLRKTLPGTWLGAGFTGRLVESRQVLRVDDLQADQGSPDLPSGENVNFRSYLGAPLLDGDTLVGTLELIAHNPGYFQLEQAHFLLQVASLAAQALQNARHFEAERNNAADLKGLTELTQALQDVSDPDILFSRLADSVYALLDVEIMGFLLYDEGRRVLYGQNPFYGLPPNVVNWTRLVIQPGSQAEELLSRAELIVSNQADQDSRLEALGVKAVAQAAGIRHLILAPLASAGRLAGYLQAAQPRSGGGFDEAGIRRVQQIAAQVAPIVDNAFLVGEARRRVQRSETFRRIASLTSSSATLDEVLKYSMLDLVRLLQADAGMILLVNTRRGELAPHLASVYGIEVDYLTLLSQRLDEEADLSQLVTGSQQPLLAGNLAQESLHPIYHSLARELDLQSTIIVPLVTREQGVGELLIASHQPDLYDYSDERSVATAAGQLAGAIGLAEEHQRTAILLQIITELSASLDLDQVLQRTLRVLNEFIRAQKVSLWLAPLEQPGLRRLATLDGDRLLVVETSQEQDLARQVLKSGTYLRLDDLALGAPGPQDYGAVGSVLAVPLVIGAEILGVLEVFSDRAGDFTSGHLELVLAAANQMAVAVNNAGLYNLIRDQAEGLGGMLRDQQIATSRSQAILEAVADGVLVTDSQMKVTLFNASAEKILGLQRDRVLESSLDQFSGMFGKAAQTWMAAIQNWSHDPLSAQTGESYAEKLDLENGRVVEVHLAPVSLRSDFLGTVSIIQDITHQVEVDRLKSEFVATVSHELRTPMTSIKGYVEILLMGAAGSLSENQTHFLEVIHANTDRLIVLVNDLLNISKIESGRIELLPQPLDLDGLVSDALLIIEQRSAEDGKSIHLRKDIPLNLPQAWGDVERVRQILENLLDNAYLYNQNGGSIQVHAGTQGREIQVDVVDTGSGIPPDEQGRVFERFYRGESPLILGVSGTGLGLSIVQSLVTMQGGRIWLQSQGIPGKGSTFSFTLPVYNGQQKSAHEENIEGISQWQRS